jgi:hypothetical protein
MIAYSFVQVFGLSCCMQKVYRELYFQNKNKIRITSIVDLKGLICKIICITTSDWNNLIFLTP